MLAILVRQAVQAGEMHVPAIVVDRHRMGDDLPPRGQLRCRQIGDVLSGSHQCLASVLTRAGVAHSDAHEHSFRCRVGLARLWELPEKLIKRSRCIIIDHDRLYPGIPQGSRQNACRKIANGDGLLFAHKLSLARCP